MRARVRTLLLLLLLHRLRLLLSLCWSRLIILRRGSGRCGEAEIISQVCTDEACVASSTLQRPHMLSAAL